MLTRILAALFSLLGTAIQAGALVFHMAPLLALTGGQALGGLAEPQLQRAPLSPSPSWG